MRQAAWLVQYAVLVLLVLGGIGSSFFPSEAFSVGVLLAFFAWIAELSPTRILFGERNMAYDLLVVCGFLLVGIEAIGRLLPMAQHAGMGIAAGVVLLLTVSIVLSYTTIVHKPSLLALLGQRGTPSAWRPVVTAMLLIGFLVMLVLPLLRWAVAAAAVPPIVALLALGLLLLLLQRRGHIAMPAIARADEILRGIGAAAHGMFTSSSTLLLGISGLLVLYFVLDAGASLLRTAPIMLQRSAPGGLPLVALATLGMTLLILLPALMWRSIFLIRTTGDHAHLPDWSGTAVGAILACMTAALLLIRGSSVLLIWSAVAAVFLLCVGVARIGDYPRRVLMAGPLLAAIVYFGAYAYGQFVAAFLEYSAKLIPALASGSYGTAAALLLLFGMTVIFSVAGYLSFLYELWRD